jgi:hypothetical protein
VIRALTWLRDAGFGLPLARSVVGRGVDVLVDLAHVPPPGLRGGAVDGIAADGLPVVLLYQPGADEAGIIRTLRAVSELQSSAGVRVVLVLDRPHLALVRQAGVLAELIPASDAWTRRLPDRSWPEEVRRRLAQIRRDYRAAAVFEVGRDGLNDAQRATITARFRSGSPVGRGMAAWRRLRAAALRLIDPPLQARVPRTGRTRRRLG